MEMKFYRCSRCGQIIAIVKKTGSPVICCGAPMEEIIPGVSDGAIMAPPGKRSARDVRPPPGAPPSAACQSRPRRDVREEPAAGRDDLRGPRS